MTECGICVLIWISAVSTPCCKDTTKNSLHFTECSQVNSVSLRVSFTRKLTCVISIVMGQCSRMKTPKIGITQNTLSDHTKRSMIQKEFDILLQILWSSIFNTNLNRHIHCSCFLPQRRIHLFLNPFLFPLHNGYGRERNRQCHIR